MLLGGIPPACILSCTTYLPLTLLTACSAPACLWACGWDTCRSHTTMHTILRSHFLPACLLDAALPAWVTCRPGFSLPACLPGVPPATVSLLDQVYCTASPPPLGGDLEYACLPGASPAAHILLPHHLPLRACLGLPPACLSCLPAMALHRTSLHLLLPHRFTADFTTTALCSSQEGNSLSTSCTPGWAVGDLPSYDLILPFSLHLGGLYHSGILRSMLFLPPATASLPACLQVT